MSISKVRWFGRSAAGALLGLMGLVSVAAAEESTVKRLPDFAPMAKGSVQRHNCAVDERVYAFDVSTQQRLNEGEIYLATEIDFGCVMSVDGNLVVQSLKRAVHAVPGRGFLIKNVESAGLGLGTRGVVFEAR